MGTCPALQTYLETRILNILERYFSTQNFSNKYFQTYPERDRAREQRAHKSDCCSPLEHHREGRADCCYGPGGKLALFTSCKKMIVPHLFLMSKIFPSQGQVIEKGNHRELVEKGGRYAELWEHQQQQEKEAVLENEKVLEKLSG